ncbi:MAG: ATP-binding cassette domain-containing protein [Rhodospirillaceae bacterium]|nr:ATP-binding cassette domain-containing protein [Rhodospirillaceae bacterium]
MPGDAGAGCAAARPQRPLLPPAPAGGRPVTATAAAGKPPIVALEGVSKRFVKRLDVAMRVANMLGSHLREEVVRAVDTVDLAVDEGEVLGLVGESGCGKSTLGRIVAGVHAASGGRMLYRGQDVADLHGQQARDVQLKIQMIFQDPMSSLNPRLRVGDIIGEAPRVHGLVGRRALDGYVDEIMGHVGLDTTYKRRYPHQFSGGQRQRIAIARALAVKPEFLVCDEAVAALDVSIQAQVLNLFMRLREELGLTYLFISHDLGVVEHLSDRVMIMYLGRIVEQAPTEALFAAPNHPYTQALLAEIPRLVATRRTYTPVKGEIPTPLNPPPGCHFHPRCPHVLPRCRDEVPRLKAVAAGHWSACHLNDQA